MAPCHLPMSIPLTPSPLTLSPPHLLTPSPPYPLTFFSSKTRLVTHYCSPRAASTRSQYCALLTLCISTLCNYHFTLFPLRSHCSQVQRPLYNHAPLTLAVLGWRASLASLLRSFHNCGVRCPSHFVLTLLSTRCSIRGVPSLDASSTPDRCTVALFWRRSFQRSGATREAEFASLVEGPKEGHTQRVGEGGYRDKHSWQGEGACALPRPRPPPCRSC